MILILTKEVKYLVVQTIRYIDDNCFYNEFVNRIARYSMRHIFQVRQVAWEVYVRAIVRRQILKYRS